MTRQKAQQRSAGIGFTLIELMIAMTLTVILTYGLWLIFGQASDIVAVSGARVELYQTARTILNALDEQISAAFVDEPKGRFFWMYDAERSTPHFSGSGATINNYDSDHISAGYGFVRDNGLVQPWDIDWFQGLYVQVSIPNKEPEVRRIVSNQEHILVTTPAWNSSPLSNRSYRIQQSYDQLSFFTTAPNPGAFHSTKAQIYLSTQSRSDGTLKYPALRIKRQVTRWQDGAYREIVSDGDLGVRVTDFNVEYFDDTEYVNGACNEFRQANDYHPMWVRKVSEGSSRWLKFEERTKVDPDNPDSKGTGRGFLPSVVRVSIRLLDRSERVERSFSQEIAINRAARKPPDDKRSP